MLSNRHFSYIKQSQISHVIYICDIISAQFFVTSDATVFLNTYTRDIIM